MDNKTRFEFNKLKDVINANSERDEGSKQAAIIKVYTVRALCVVSLIMTMMNIAKHYTVMTVATSVLAVGFLVAAFLYERLRKIKAGNLLVAIMIGVMFTYFAISGNNFGFAILWILLVPAFASNVINLKLGLILCAYFQLLLIVMFYTPLRAHFLVHYTETFCGRYPVLYFACFVVSYLIVVEKEFYALQVDKMAHTDVLSGVANRREYEDVLTRLHLEWDEVEHLRIFSMDLNGLKKANDKVGHRAGDELIKGAADCMKAAFPDAMCIARIGGDEFSVITAAPEDEIDIQVADFADNIRMWRGKLINRLTISSGSASKAEFPGLSVYELANKADKAMYEEKRRYYIAAGVDRRNQRTLTTKDIKDFDPLKQNSKSKK